MGHERWKDPAHELVRDDLVGPGQLGLGEVLGELLVEELVLVVQWLRFVDRALHELSLEPRIGLHVEDQGVLGERPLGALVLELDDAAAGVVDEVVVAVDLPCLDDELLDVAHRADLGLAVQPLAPLELGDRQAAQVRPADLAQERRDRREVVHGDVARDVDGVATQEVAQETDLHCLALDVVEDRLGEILRADPVVARVVEPLVRRQLVRERRLADARHAEQRDRLVRPAQELGARHFHGQAPLRLGRDYTGPIHHAHATRAIRANITG